MLLDSDIERTEIAGYVTFYNVSLLTMAYFRIFCMLYLTTCKTTCIYLTLTPSSPNLNHIQRDPSFLAHGNAQDQVWDSSWPPEHNRPRQLHWTRGQRLQLGHRRGWVQERPTKLPGVGDTGHGKPTGGCRARGVWKYSRNSLMREKKRRRTEERIRIVAKLIESSAPLL